MAGYSGNQHTNNAPPSYEETFGGYPAGPTMSKGAMAGFVTPGTGVNPSAPPAPVGFQDLMLNNVAGQVPLTPQPRQVDEPLPTFTNEMINSSLENYASSHCCAQSLGEETMEILRVVKEFGYRYTLTSLVESREMNEITVPFTGELIDGPENGPQPGIWDVRVIPPETFVASTVKVKVPHSDIVVLCSKCTGSGATLCTQCNGTKSSVCFTCSGSGRFGNGHCSGCNGNGRQPCMSCSGRGNIKCRGCEGHFRQKKYREIVVKWKVNKLQEVCMTRGQLGIQSPELLAELTKKDTRGTKILAQITIEGRSEVQGVPDVVTRASNNLMSQEESRKSAFESIVKQFHEVTQIPAAHVDFNFRGKQDSFYIYGLDAIITFPNGYPKNGCCSIL